MCIRDSCPSFSYDHFRIQSAAKGCRLGYELYMILELFLTSPTSLEVPLLDYFTITRTPVQHKSPDGVISVKGVAWNLQYRDYNLARYAICERLDTNYAFQTFELYSRLLPSDPDHLAAFQLFNVIASTRASGSVGYEEFWNKGKVSLIELAADNGSVAAKKAIGWILLPGTRKSQFYEPHLDDEMLDLEFSTSIKAGKPDLTSYSKGLSQNKTNYLRKRGSPMSIAQYDRKQRLNSRRMPLDEPCKLFRQVTRIEIRLCDPGPGMPAASFAKLLPNHFEKPIVVDPALARKQTPRDVAQWKKFLKMMPGVNLHTALKEVQRTVQAKNGDKRSGEAIRQRYTKLLKDCRASWFDPKSIWADFPEAIDRLSAKNLLQPEWSKANMQLLDLAFPHQLSMQEIAAVIAQVRQNREAEIAMFNEYMA